MKLARLQNVIVTGCFTFIVTGLLVLIVAFVL